MNKKAFTLVEVLLAMAIVGIVAAVTANSLGNISANKTKLAFQNNYKHMNEVVNSIITDETIYPKIALSSYDDFGRMERVSMCNYDSEMFPKQFLEHTKVIQQTKITGGYSFETTSGTFWVVVKNPSIGGCSTPSAGFDNSDYYITFDVNGISEGTNCPYSGSSLNSISSGTCSNPDTFKFGLSSDGVVIFDNQSIYNGKDLRTYLYDDAHLLSADNK